MTCEEEEEEEGTLVRARGRHQQDAAAVAYITRAVISSQARFIVSIAADTLRTGGNHRQTPIINMSTTNTATYTQLPCIQAHERANGAHLRHRQHTHAIQMFL